MELNTGTDRLRELDGAPHVLDRRDVPQHGPALVGVSSDAAIILSAAFLAPWMKTVPVQGRAAANAVADLGALGHVDALLSEG